MVAKKLKILTEFVFILTTILILYSCDSKAKLIFSKKDVEILTKSNAVIPTQYDLYTFFGKGENNVVIKLHYKEIKEIYEKDFKDMNYSDYVYDLLNLKLKIRNSYGVSFLLNKEIYEKYTTNTFKTFMDLYCVGRSNNFQVKKGLSQNDFFTVSYLLFINSYFVTFDDYTGVYQIIPFDKVLR